MYKSPKNDTTQFTTLLLSFYTSQYNTTERCHSMKTRKAVVAVLTGQPTEKIEIHHHKNI